MVVVIALWGCGSPTTVLPAGQEWADGVFSVSARLHSQVEPVDGRLCTMDEAEERCARTEEGRAWLDGLQGETTLRVRRQDSIETLTAIEMRQDVWLQAALYSYDSPFVTDYSSEIGWDASSTGIVDLWVMDRNDPGLLGLAGAEVHSPEGQLFVSDGGPLQSGNVTGGGPAWIVGLAPGEHTVAVSHPEGPCDRGVMGWPADDPSSLRVPVRAGWITTVWVGCTPL